MTDDNALPRFYTGPVTPAGIKSRDVRNWARANGWPALGSNGRLPQAAIDAYVSAHPTEGA